VHLDPGEVREYLREQVQMIAHGLTPEEAGSDDTMFSGAISSPNDLHLLTIFVPEPRISDEVSTITQCFDALPVRTEDLSGECALAGDSNRGGLEPTGGKASAQPPSG
jgi:hypothetical protein